MNNDNTILRTVIDRTVINRTVINRRNLLKTTVFGSIAGLMVSLNPVKLFSSQEKIKDKTTNRSLTEVKIHPLAIKRNNNKFKI